MAHARPVVPERFYFVTRRCTRRELLLRPGWATNQAVLYCLAEAAQHYGVEVLWLQTMSNHLHYGVRDVLGNYPGFLQRFHGYLAKVLNCQWRRSGNLLEVEQTSMVELADAEAAFDKMIYSLTNPVKDQLVKRAEDWPGACSLRAQLDDEEVVVRRPSGFFPEDSSMPSEVRLRFVRPEALGGARCRTHAAWAAAIRKAVAKVERDAHEVRKQTGRRVMGAGAVMAQSPFDAPKTPSPRGRMSPEVATKDSKRRAELLRRNRGWRAAYRRALERYRGGDKAVQFPAGTWKLYEEGHVTRADT